MLRRDVSAALIASATGAALLSKPAAAQSCIAPCYPQTAAEIAASITPTNLGYPPLCVDRYGTNSAPGTTLMTQAWANAIKVAGVYGGVVTCLQTRYLVGQLGSSPASLVLSGLVTIDGGNSGLSYTAGTGAQIYSQTNLPIIGYASATTNRCGLRNINIVGVTTAGTSQHGVIVNPTYPVQVPIDIENVGIFNCGYAGLWLQTSYGSRVANVYIQNCTNGLITGPNCGAGVFLRVSVASCTSAGIDVGSTNGQDVFIACSSQGSAYGIVFESGAVDNQIYGLHTESNSQNGIWWKTGSDRNKIYGQTTGSSEGLPLNNGGAGNAYVGATVAGGVTTYGYTSGTVHPIPQTGWGTPTGASIVSNFPGGSATLVQTSAAVAELITYFRQIGILAP